MYNPETYGFYDAQLERFKPEARWAMELKRMPVRVPLDIGVPIDFASEATKLARAPTWPPLV